MEEQHALNNGTPAYWAAMRKRKILCEGNFAIQKAGHNLTRTRKRGLGNAFEHCLLFATAMNVRRMVRILTSPGRPPEEAASSTTAQYGSTSGEVEMNRFPENMADVGGPEAGARFFDGVCQQGLLLSHNVICGSQKCK